MMSNLNSRAGELKSQGAAMAAQDSKSSVTAEDAEAVMADESNKAGVPAFQFDPDASPEAKAAQVRSVSLALSYPIHSCSLLTLSSMYHQAFITTKNLAV